MSDHEQNLAKLESAATELFARLKSQNHPSLVGLLPLILSLRSKPYTIQKYFPFEPLFRTRLARRIVLRTGRQVSKCRPLGATESVLAINGRPLKPEELAPGVALLGYNVSSGTWCANRVVRKHQSEPSRIVTIVTAAGSRIRVTPNHPVWTPAGWVEAGQLRRGDQIARYGSGGQFTNAINVPDAVLLGLAIAITKFTGRAVHKTARHREFSQWASKLCHIKPRTKDRHELLMIFKDSVLKEAEKFANITSLPAWVYELDYHATRRLVTALARIGEHRLDFAITNEVLALGAKCGIYLRRFGRGIQKHPNAKRLNDIVWDKIIRAATGATEEPTWDIETETHNYVLDLLLVHNTTCLSANTVIQSATCPYFNTLIVTPIGEQAKRISALFIKPFIYESNVRYHLIDHNSEDRVRSRTFINGSRMFFETVFRSPDRCRGIPADKLFVDEVQDVDDADLPVLHASIQGSRFGGFYQYAGTPKTTDGTLECLWNESSQAEWCMTCVKCGHENVPALSHDLVDMIGESCEDLSMQNPGIVCGKCKKPQSVFPERGRWVHGIPSRRWSFAGYHVPQIILPLHYASREKWTELVARRHGAQRTSWAKFLNETLGEPCDESSKLVTATEIRAAACLPWRCSLDEAVPRLGDYAYRVLAVDWGGGGEAGESYTVITALGIRGDEIHVLWALKSYTPLDHPREARLVLEAATRFRVHAIAHDYTGAGTHRETMIVQAGWPTSRIMPFWVIRAGASAKIVTYKPASKQGQRAYYQLDKTRGIHLVCDQIKTRHVKFFSISDNPDDPGAIIMEFLSFIEHRVEARAGRDLVTVFKAPGTCDDFGMAALFGCCALWHMVGRWPNVADQHDLRVDPAIYADLAGNVDES